MTSLVNIFLIPLTSPAVIALAALTASSPDAPFGASPALALAIGLAVVALGGFVWLRRTEVTSKK
jgi:hypothetical protein